MGMSVDTARRKRKDGLNRFGDPDGRTGNGGPFHKRNKLRIEALEFRGDRYRDCLEHCCEELAKHTGETTGQAYHRMMTWHKEASDARTD